MKMKVSMKKIVSLAKRRGFVFPNSEIYGGLGSTWDYGPVGVLLKRNIKNLWWADYVKKRDDIVGLDTAILMNPKVWEASGHIQSFSDPLTECKNCHKRFRADHLVQKTQKEEHTKINEGDLEKIAQHLKYIKCPQCGGKLTPPKQFNLMFKTFIGPQQDESSTAYLRPETAQGIFVNFDLVRETSRMKLPFGIAQMGKAFRNEITTGNFLFRVREMEQMEIEWFCSPKANTQNNADKNPKEWFEYWKKERLDWYQKYGIKPENLRLTPHGPGELAHYAKEAVDIEYRWPFGWKELEGIANRTNYDLKRHSELSGKDLTYFDQKLDEKYFPYVIEPSAGVDRAFLAFLVDAYHEEKVPTKKDKKSEKRIVLKFDPKIAPIKVAVFPLLSNKEKLVKKAKKIYSEINPNFMSIFDSSGSIGRRYRRQDEIGTPFGITVDFQTLEDNTVTLRDRDSMKQVRISVDSITENINQALEGEDISALGTPLR